MPREITEAEAELLAMARAAHPPGTVLEWGYGENGEWCILELGDAIQCTGPLLTHDDFNTRGRLRMPRYWVIAPVESRPPELFDAVWQFDLANSCISIGWSDLGDISKMSRDQIVAGILSRWPEKPPQARGLVANMLWAFFNEIQPGDIVLARRGRKTLAGIGTVTGRATHGPTKNPKLSQDYAHSYFMEVAWQDLPRDKAFPTIVFPMYTVAEFSEAQYRSVIDVNPQPLPPPPTLETAFDEYEFVLEKYLEEFIVTNFHKIFKGQLRLFVDSENNEGQQYSTEVGPIDILAVEQDSDSLVVIELKKGRTSDQVVGQVLRYMGWVKANLCNAGQTVKGLVICKSHDLKLDYALSMTKNISVLYYSVDFKLSETK